MQAPYHAAVPYPFAHPAAVLPLVRPMGRATRLAWEQLLLPLQLPESPNPPLEPDPPEERPMPRMAAGRINVNTPNRPQGR